MDETGDVLAASLPVMDVSHSFPVNPKPSTVP